MAEWVRNMWKIICDYIMRGTEVLYQKAVEAFQSMKAFYDNLSEKLKDSIAQAMRKVEETWNFMKELPRKCKESAVQMFSKLMSICGKVSAAVEWFLSKAKEVCDATRKRFKIINDLRKLEWLQFVCRLLEFINKKLAEEDLVNEKSFYLELLKYIVDEESVFCIELLMIVLSLIKQCGQYLCDKTIEAYNDLKNKVKQGVKLCRNMVESLLDKLLTGFKGFLYRGKCLLEKIFIFASSMVLFQ